jgi:hypothetical protein
LAEPLFYETSAAAECLLPNIESLVEDDSLLVEQGRMEERIDKSGLLLDPIKRLRLKIEPFFHRNADVFVKDALAVLREG